MAFKVLRSSEHYKKRQLTLHEEDNVLMCRIGMPPTIFPDLESTMAAIDHTVEWASTRAGYTVLTECEYEIVETDEEPNV